MREAARRASADEFVGKIPGGFEAQLGERGTTLSGGQRQRLAIARAIFRDAPILIFDEATSQIDTESEQIVTCGHVRVLSAGYLASRFSFAGERVGRAAVRVVDTLGLSERLVPISLGDLIAVYARKPEEPSGTP